MVEMTESGYDGWLPPNQFDKLRSEKERDISGRKFKQDDNWKGGLDILLEDMFLNQLMSLIKEYKKEVDYFAKRISINLNSISDAYYNRDYLTALGLAQCQINSWAYFSREEYKRRGMNCEFGICMIRIYNTIADYIIEAAEFEGKMRT